MKARRSASKHIPTAVGAAGKRNTGLDGQCLPAGYVGFLTALGVPAALEVGAAFALVKRGRELLYTTLGLGLLVAPPLRLPVRAPAAAAADSA